MITTTYLLPLMLVILVLSVVALCFIHVIRIKLIRRVSIAVCSIIAVLVTILFSNIVIFNNYEQVSWTASGWEATLSHQASVISLNFGIKLAVDVFTAWMLLIITIVGLTILCLGHYIKTRHKSYYILTLCIYTLSLIVLLSKNIWVSFAALALMAVGIFFMAGIWSKAKHYSYATRFIFLQSVGFICIAIGLFIIQFIVTGYQEQALILEQLPRYVEDYLYLNNSQMGYRNMALVSIVVGFAFIIPLIGFQRAVIDLFKHAHYPVLVVVAGIYLPIIAYMAKQLMNIFFIDYIPSLQPIIVIACVMQVTVMAINLWREQSIKVWIGYLILAILPITYILLLSDLLVTVSFALLALISFMLTSCLLLTVMAALSERQEEHTLDNLKGLFTRMPYLAGLLLLSLLAVSGLPIFSQFFAIFHTFYVVYDFSVVLFIIILMAIFLIAINIFLHISKLFRQSLILNNKKEQLDLRFSEILPIITMISFVFVLGIYPNVFLDRMEAYVVGMLDWVYEFDDVVRWGTDFYWSLFVGDAFASQQQYFIAALSILTLLFTIWLSAKQKQKMLHWVLWTASHFASVGFIALVVDSNLTGTVLWQRLIFYCISVVCIYVGTHFLLSRHMYRSQYVDAEHYEGLYYKNRKMHAFFIILIITIIGLPTSPLAWIRFELISQLFIHRYILLAVVTLFSFAFVMRALWHWLAIITFPVANPSLLNKDEQIEDWTWTKFETLFVVSSVSINTILMFVYILM